MMAILRVYFQSLIKRALGLCGFQADVEEPEWLNAQMRSRVSALIIAVCLTKKKKSNKALRAFRFICSLRKGQRTKLCKFQIFLWISL